MSTLSEIEIFQETLRGAIDHATEKDVSIYAILSILGDTIAGISDALMEDEERVEQEDDNE